MLEQTVRHFITANFLYGDESRSIDSDESLLESGIVDSMGVLELVAFVERTFHIRVENHELVPDNIDSISNVTAFVRTKLSR